MISRKEQLIIAAIKKGSFPRYLYKYRDISDNTKSILKNGEFWFAQPKPFNDPFDCNLSETRNHSVNDLRNYLSSLELDQTTVKEQVSKFKKSPIKLRYRALFAREKTLNEHGILSLSGVHDNILMWSHYASKHEGLVICLDMLEAPGFFDTPINVRYQDTYKELNFFTNKNDTIIKNISTKSSHWSYEQELRVFKPRYGLHKIENSAIKKIYFGIKTRKCDINEFMSICKNSGYKGIKFYQGNPTHGSFNLSFSKIG